MVTSEKERRASPTYSLNRIRELAGQGAVNYGSSKVLNDVENLSYGLQTVCECLASLAESDFCHAERYGPKSIWLDVYKITYNGYRDFTDDLYIKLKLDRDCLVIVLCSFHRESNS